MHVPAKTVRQKAKLAEKAKLGGIERRKRELEFVREREHACMQVDHLDDKKLLKI